MVVRSTHLMRRGATREKPSADRSTSVLLVLGIVQCTWLLLLAFVLFSLLR